MSHPHPLDGWVIDGPAPHLDWIQAQLFPAEPPADWCCGPDRARHTEACVQSALLPNGNT